ncbi:MAG: SH3 domain-containing protein [Clostridiales bacterium]|nr:SH3 domain-containing protein [Clostridiales bacterium]
MKRIDWKVYVLLGIIISVVVGFLYGTGLLGGDSGSPGSSNDPLVSQSYADGAINKRMQEMDDRILSLEAKIKTLEDELRIFTGDDLLDPATTGPATSSTPGTTTTPGQGGTGNTGSAVSAANVGKSATVTADVVNLRESASTSSNIKKRLTPSDTFTITKADKDWYQVQLSDGTVGWVAGYLVKIK